MTRTILKSTGEKILNINIKTSCINDCLAKYGIKPNGKPKKAIYNELLIPLGKSLLSEYKYFLMANKSIQLIHIRNIGVLE